MASTLRLQVLLGALDKASAPLRQITAAGGATSDQLKRTRDRLRELDRQQANLQGFEKTKRSSLDTSRALREQTDRIRQLTQELKTTDGPTRRLEQQRNAAIRQAAQLKTRYQQETAQLQTLRGQVTAAGGSTTQLRASQQRLAEQIANTNRQLQTQQDRLARTAQQQQRLAQTRSAYDRGMAARGQMLGTGAGALATGAVAGYGVSRYLSAGATFDTTMARVQSLSRIDKSDPQYQAMRDQARTLGRSTLFTSSEVAEGKAFLAMAGFDPSKTMAAMPGLLAMAKAGDMDLGTTADIGSNILTGMKLPAEQMARVADTLTAAFTRSNTSIATLGETMKYAAPGAAQFGVSLETTTAMAAKLGDAGIQGSMGGTSIRRMLSRLANPNKNAATALNKLGVNAQDADGNMRDIPTVLKEIYDASRHMGDVERGSLWKDIAGETGSNAMGILVDQAGSGELQELIRQLLESEDESNRISSVMADNWSGDWDQLKSAWEDTGIEAFEQLNIWLRETTQGITNVIRSIGDWMRENPELTATVGKVVIIGTALVTALGALSLAIASVLGPMFITRFLLAQFGIRLGALLPLIGKFASVLMGPVVGAVRAVSIVLWGLMAANPVILAIVAVVAVLAASAYLVYRNWDAIKAWFGELWQTISGYVRAAIDTIGALIASWNPVATFTTLFAAVFTYLAGLPARFTEFGANLIQGLVDGITGAFGAVRDSITGIADSTMDWFKDKLGIRSPSRVFREFGVFTMEGLAIGIQRTAGAPLAAVRTVTDSITSAGQPTLTGGAIPIDTRPPLAAPAASGGNTIQLGGIHVYPSPGMDERQLATLVAQQVADALAKRDRDAAARRRSSMHDSY